ncbi:creatininase family protein [Mesorhizobium sp. ZMM04-5]|uniref:Creatininase family protein n=1 Tax=Mesorhizobium marinum TaxID=3228790 RepID=A0ABV3R3Y5_9HYPH
MTVEAKYLSRDAFAERIARFPAVILPLGATEQHGYHLPLGVDIILAEALAVRVAEATGATVMPAMPFGYSWVWRDAPGSVTVESRTLEDVIVQIAESLARQGVRHVFLVNGHEANGATMKYASRRLWDHAGVKVWRLFYPDLGAVMAKHCESPTWHGIVHACEFETSLMLAVAPHLVDMSKAVREYPERDRGYFQGGRPMGDLSKSGVFGDATLATAEKGEAMLSIFTESMSRALREICAEG